MLDLTYLYGGRESGATPHRYGQALSAPSALKPGEPFAVAASAASRRPIVVWHLTRRCNLACEHCYAEAGPGPYPDELNTAEARALMDDLAGYKVPAVLFSGGEPLMRPDVFELAEHAGARGLRIVLSTNGTLITRDLAARLKAARFSYIGVSLDGLREVHDRMRRKSGAFDLAMRGMENCQAAGLKVGLRVTLTPANFAQAPQILDLAERQRVGRVCFYHLVPAGRGRNLEDLTRDQTRSCLEVLLARAHAWARAERPAELLTVDNPSDGPFLYLKLVAEGAAERASGVLAKLRWNGGALNGAGVGLADIDAQGNVHPDQFWMEVNLGNVRRRPFSAIWSDASHPLLAGLRDRRKGITGRCAGCKFFDCCGGGLRSRAAHLTGDPWASDPACVLTDEEIAEPAASPRGHS